AAKLKLLSEALLAFVMQQGAQVNSVSVRVQPGAGQENVTVSRPPRRLSATVLEGLQALHRRMPESPARSALKTLLDHHLAPAKPGGGQSYARTWRSNPATPAGTSSGRSKVTTSTAAGSAASARSNWLFRAW